MCECNATNDQRTRFFAQYAACFLLASDWPLRARLTSVAVVMFYYSSCFVISIAHRSGSSPAHVERSVCAWHGLPPATLELSRGVSVRAISPALPSCSLDNRHVLHLSIAGIHIRFQTPHCLTFACTTNLLPSHLSRSHPPDSCHNVQLVQEKQATAYRLRRRHPSPNPQTPARLS